MIDIYISRLKSKNDHFHFVKTPFHVR
uniref:Uncharacterized protein n=1 Tax=Anguilla anguilla TaxID=7936 RepID=A0A0E9SC41_ANGAN